MYDTIIENKISVLIPVYNDIRFLEETIVSIINQTYSNFEIILIDDNSKNSVEIKKIINAFSTRVEIIYLRNKQNLGLAASRNVGINVATGKYICFIDADDVFNPKKFQIQLDILSKDSTAAMVFSDEYIIKNGKKNEHLQHFPSGYTIVDKDLIREFVDTSFIAVFTVMIRLDIVKYLGGFNAKLKCNEDDDLWFKIMLDYKVVFSDYVSGLRRLHDANMSRNRAKMNYYQLLSLQNWYKLCCTKNQYKIAALVKNKYKNLLYIYIKNYFLRKKITLYPFLWYFKIIINNFTFKIKASDSL